MSLDPQPLQDHGEGFFTWHAYDSSCKAELWSTAYFSHVNNVLFDPIPWPKGNPQPGSPLQIVQTNGNHDRECKALEKLFSAKITNQPIGFQCIPLPGAGANEAAYFHPSSETLVVGDALIHLAPHPLMPLPDKYCTDPATLKVSLKELLKLPIRRIFFAHGAPILQDGRDALQKILP